MKALLAASSTDDYHAAIVWHGLQEVLGPDNVVDAGHCPYLHYHSKCGTVSWQIAGYHPGLYLSPGDGKSYDLLVLCASLTYEYDWHRAVNLRDAHLKEGGKIVLIEGTDGYNEIHNPPIPLDAVFRREIRPGVEYPYSAPLYHCGFAFPARWLHPDVLSRRRCWDIFAVFLAFYLPERQLVLRKMWDTTVTHFSLCCSGGMEHNHYWQHLRDSKLCLCPPGGALSDTMRFAEAMAAGSIPVFVGLPPKHRHPWLTEEHAFFCSVDNLPATLDRALSSDLDSMRLALVNHVSKHHTTRARAQQILEAVGLQP